MNLNLKRVVMEVFGGCNYTCQMCPQSNPGRGKSFTRKLPLKQFSRILDELIPKYGKPQINLEGSGEPTMAKDLPEYIKEVKKRDLKCFMYCNGARLNGQFMKDVVDAGIKAGVGATLEIEVGAGIDQRFYKPVPVQGTVRSIDDGHYAVLSLIHI